ncbi:hypothetical protein C9439_02175 [archaeon SCG-AAA382B04]|nr:hypothetical protein C9439_02175 [archaeon SCG-AAA382B04]
MAYIRTKQIPPNEGNYYAYLVKGERSGDKVNQKVLQYIGRVNPRDISIDPDEVEEEYQKYLLDVDKFSKGNWNKMTEGMGADGFRIGGDEIAWFPEGDEEFRVSAQKMDWHDGKHNYGFLIHVNGDKLIQKKAESMEEAKEMALEFMNNNPDTEEWLESYRKERVKQQLINENELSKEKRGAKGSIGEWEKKESIKGDVVEGYMIDHEDSKEISLVNIKEDPDGYTAKAIRFRPKTHKESRRFKGKAEYGTLQQKIRIGEGLTKEEAQERVRSFLEDYKTGVKIYGESEPRYNPETGEIETTSSKYIDFDFRDSKNFNKLSNDRKKKRIKEIFKEEAEDIWDFEGLGEDLDVDVVVKKSSKKTKKKAPASLVKPSKGQAIGDTLVKTPKDLKLRVSPKVMKNYSGDKVKDLMKHEALHLGYNRHNEDFKKKADSEGAPISERHGERGYIGIQEQENKGERYETVDKIESYDEAKERAEELAEENPNKSYRLDF